MRNEDEADLTRLASWVGREVLGPVIRWVEAERLPLSVRVIQARAKRAVLIGEIDEVVYAKVMMRTDPILRWCWADGAGVKTSAWIEPSGAVNPVEYGGHWNWIKQNEQRLVAEGVFPAGLVQKAVGTASMKMMVQGWVRYSGGTVMTFPMPNAAQIAAIEGLIRESNPPEGFAIQFMIEGDGIRSDVPAKDVLAQGVAQTLATLAQGAPAQGETPLGEHRLAAMGGPFDQGDGQDVQNSYMEQAQDGSTAPIERGYDYLAQDWTPEVWWSRDLLDYLKKNYPGKKDVGGAEPDAGSIPSATGPGQQFASSVAVVLFAAKASAQREAAILSQADVADPSDPDIQHDQVNEDSMSTHLTDKSDPQAQRRTRIGGENRLRDRWIQRRSDKGVEQQIIKMEKDHLEPDQIVQELQTEGVPPQVIDETYEHREKNLFKIVGG